MRTLIVTEFLSLDGVIDSPGGDGEYRHSGWTHKHLPFDPAAYELKGREQVQAGALLLGRRSFDLFAPVWPSMDDFAGYNAMPKYVVSHRELGEHAWGEVSRLGGIDEVARLREGEGAPILVHASGDLVGQLIAAGLVDRFHLLVFPMLLGAGTRLFPQADAERVALEVAEHEVYGNGVVKLVYDVVR